MKTTVNNSRETQHVMHIREGQLIFRKSTNEVLIKIGSSIVSLTKLKVLSSESDFEVEVLNPGETVTLTQE